MIRSGGNDEPVVAPPRTTSSTMRWATRIAVFGGRLFIIDMLADPPHSKYGAFRVCRRLAGLNISQAGVRLPQQTRFARCVDRPCLRCWMYLVMIYMNLQQQEDPHGGGLCRRR